MFYNVSMTGLRENQRVFPQPTVKPARLPFQKPSVIPAGDFPQLQALLVSGIYAGRMTMSSLPRLLDLLHDWFLSPGSKWCLASQSWSEVLAMTWPRCSSSTSHFKNNFPPAWHQWLLEIMFNLLTSPVGSQMVGYQGTKDMTQDGGVHKDRCELWEEHWVGIQPG